MDNKIAEVLSYNPETGDLTWIKRTSNRIKVGDKAGRIRRDCRGYTNYMDTNVFGKSYPNHRLGWFLTHGSWPSHDIDHIDGDGMNNKLSNLRDVSRSDNLLNTGVWRHNTSGIKGVYLRKDTGLWTAKAQYKGKVTHLGCFKTKEEAAEARAKASRGS